MQHTNHTQDTYLEINLILRKCENLIFIALSIWNVDIER